MRSNYLNFEKTTKALGRSIAYEHIITSKTRDVMKRSTRYDLDEENAPSTAAEMPVDSV